MIAITGTPGVGKTSVSAELRSREYKVVDMNDHLRKHGLLGERDEGRDTYNIDMEALNDSLEEYREEEGFVFLDSHLAHECDCSRILVLRCDPHILAKRLEARGYGPDKVRENVQSEILDVILCEATDSDIPVYEVDCSEGDPASSADAVEQIVKGEFSDYLPGRTDWSEEMDRWF